MYGVPGRMTDATRALWAGRWKHLLGTPADAARLGQDLRRWQQLHGDIALADSQLAGLLAQSDRQVLTGLPGVAVVMAAEFSAFMPIDRWPTPEHLYSAPRPGWAWPSTATPSWASPGGGAKPATHSGPVTGGNGGADSS